MKTVERVRTPSLDKVRTFVTADGARAVVETHGADECLAHVVLDPTHLDVLIADLIALRERLPGRVRTRHLT